VYIAKSLVKKILELEFSILPSYLKMQETSRLKWFEYSVARLLVVNNEQIMFKKLLFYSLMAIVYTILMISTVICRTQAIGNAKSLNIFVVIKSKFC